MAGSTPVRAVLVALVVLASTPAAAVPSGDAVTWQAACEEAVLLLPTGHENVAPLVPPLFRAAIVGVGPPGAEQAVLLVIVNQCGESWMESHGRRFTVAEAAEVLVAVMVMSEHSDEDVQFYALASYVDWAPLAARYRSLGLPTEHVPRMDITITRSYVLGVGTVSAVIPAAAELLTVRGVLVSALPPAIDARASHFAVGPRGVVRVDHHSVHPPSHRLTPAVLATVTTDRPDGEVATAMGAPRRHAPGVFMDKDHAHRHTAYVSTDRTDAAVLPAGLLPKTLEEEQ